MEQTSVEADGDDDEVVGDTLPLVLVLDRDDDVSVARFDRRCPSGKCAEPPRVIEDRLGLPGTHTSGGPLEELAPMGLRQPRPVAGVGVEAVLVVALAARIEN